MGSEQEYLQNFQAHAAESFRYLTDDQYKPERERAVCRAFLRGGGVPFVETELVAPSSEPVDVSFREARFQVRELLPEGRRRGDELRLRLIRARRARSMEDVAVDWQPRLTPMSREVLTLEITKALDKKARKYGRSQCSNLDALVYVNLTWTHFMRHDSAPGNTVGLAAQAWRSVSLVFPPHAIVLYAISEAPGFLQQLVGRVRTVEWSELDELFDVQQGT